MAGSSASALAGTSSDNSNAGAMHARTTVHFSGLIQHPTCSFAGKSMKVTLPTVNSSEIQSAKGELPNTTAFSLKLNCPSQADLANLKLVTTGANLGGDLSRVYTNTHGEAQGVGLVIENAAHIAMLNGDDSIAELIRNDGTLKLLAAYYHEPNKEVTSGRFGTDVVFETAYK